MKQTEIESLFIDEGIAWNPSMYEQILNDPDILVGYEIEFIAKLRQSKQNTDWISINKIKNLDNFEDWFKLPRNWTSSLNNLYKEKIEELSTQILQKQLISKNLPTLRAVYKSHNPKWKQWFKSDRDLDTHLADLSQDSARQKRFANIIATNQYPLNKFVSENAQIIVNNFKLEPLFGWANPEHTEIFTEEFDDESEYNYKHIARELQDLLGEKVSLTSSRYKHWLLTDDGSIDSDNRGGTAVELVGPPMQIKTALEKLNLIFNWMQTNGSYTNNSTGFHVGVSYKNKTETKKVDPLKLILFLEEKYLLDKFNRLKNTYTEGHLEDIRKLIGDLKDYESDKIFTGSSIQQIMSDIRKGLSTDKYKAVNLSKQKQYGYFEFRIMGNKNYNLRFNDIQDTILRYGFIVKISHDPQAFRKEFLHELGKMIISTFKEPMQYDIKKRIVLGKTNDPTKYDQMVELFNNGKKSRGTAYMLWFISRWFRRKYYGDRIKPPMASKAMLVMRIFAKKNKITQATLAKGKDQMAALDLVPKYTLTDARLRQIYNLLFPTTIP